MTISFLSPVSSGNAVRVLLMPPDGAQKWRVLRKRADTIATFDDAGANIVFEGDDQSFIDFTDLVNGQVYFYRAFYWLQNQWVAYPSRSVTPHDSFSDISADVVDLVRDRLDLGFAVYLAKGRFQNDISHIPVMLSTPAWEDVTFPLVTVHLNSLSQANRFIGEEMGIGDAFPDTSELGEVRGWLSHYQILVICWCINGDVRAEMRKSLTSLVQANLPIFEAAGMTEVEITFSDADDMNTYQVPMYQATCTLSCIAPTAIENRIPVIRDVFVTSI